jgi:serine/threonine-protein kinase
MNGDRWPGAAWVLGGRYRLISQVGAGGMAVVWQAHDSVLARTVAVKVLATHYADDPESRDLIRREARAAAGLSHPNIAQVYDYGEADVEGEIVPYVVMELIRGGTLHQRLADGPVLPRYAMRVCAEIAAALTAAHAEGLAHRDIKPANVMLAPTGVKVVDFGIAAAIRPPGAGPYDFEVFGTPAYLAPERLLHDAVEPASDVYALGVLLYRLLTGHSPWTSETTTQMLTAHIYLEPAPLMPMFQVPDYVIALCNRCLDKDPARRPSAREAAALLAHAAGLQVITDQPVDDGRPATDPEPSVLIRAQASPGPPPSAGPSPGPPPSAGPSSAEPLSVGPSSAGPSFAWPPSTGPSSAGPSSAGLPSAGLPSAGLQSAGPSSAGLQSAGPSFAWPPSTGPSSTGPSSAGPSSAGPLSAGAVGAVGAVGKPASAPVDGRPNRAIYAAVALGLLAAVAAALLLLRPDRPAPVSAPAPGPSLAPSTGPAGPGPSPGRSATPSAAPPGGATPGSLTVAPGPASPGAPAATTPTTPPASRPASPAPTVATTNPPAAPVERTLSSAAGSVRATCPGPDVAQILSWTATKPYRVTAGDGNAGPAPSVTFTHGNRQVTMTVTCAGGVPSADSA